MKLKVSETVSMSKEGEEKSGGIRQHRWDTKSQFSSIFADIHLYILVGQGRAVGISTGYGLEGPGIVSLWGRDFPHLSRPALGPNQPPVRWIPGLSWG